MALITDNLDAAILDLKNGKPVAIPTETVYGLAAMVDNEEAIRAVFAMKKRPLNHPLIVHVAQDWDLSELVLELPEYAKVLMKHFWPGPLTLVLPCTVKKVNPLITGGQQTVAIRCPAHPIAQELLKKLNTPLVAPSANPFGKISPTTAEHVRQSFINEQLTILDGGRCLVGIESTIVDATQALSYQILRHGMIGEKELTEVVPSKYTPMHTTIRVPGKLDSHYQPQKPLYYFIGSESLHSFCSTNREKVYVIATEKPESVKDLLYHAVAQDPEKAAYDLYFQLRKADESTAECILIQLPPESAEWEGVRERILKAGSLLEPKTH